MLNEIQISDNPYCSIDIGDCRLALRAIAVTDMRYDLIFADPPFNQGEGYSTWNDKLPYDAFWKFTYEWLGLLDGALAKNGSIWFNVPDSMASQVDSAMRELWYTRLNWCIWHYRFGQCTRAKFISSKTHLLHYCRRGEESYITFNSQDVLVDSDRASKYNDNRTLNSLTPGKRMPFDVWCIENDGDNWGRLQGNNKERVFNHPNQLPEKLLERIIRVSSNEDDWVLDLFCGSGTTLVVAKELKRNSVGFEIGEREARQAAARIKQGAVRV